MLFFQYFSSTYLIVLIIFYVFYVMFCDIEMRMASCIFFFQAEDGIRYLVRSRGLGDVYKRQVVYTGFNLFLSFPLNIITFLKLYPSSLIRSPASGLSLIHI